MSARDPQILDIEKVILSRAGEKGKNIPKFIIRWFEKFVHLDFINEYLKKGGVRNFLGTAISFALMCACHVGYTGMVAIAWLIYLLVYRLCCFTGMNKIQKSGKRDLEIIVAIVCGFALIGIILFPSLKGGLASNTSKAGQAAASFFQSIFIFIFFDGNGNIHQVFTQTICQKFCCCVRIASAAEIIDHRSSPSSN